MVHNTIEVFLQPPSPTMNNACKLPPVKSLLPLDDDQQQQQSLPSIRLTDDDPIINRKETSNSSNNKLDTIEPTFNSLSISTSPYQSPLMSFSSPSSATSSISGSPLISPLQDSPFLLPPPDTSSLRRCRSISNASNTSSPITSPYTHFTFRSLSEPPTLDLPPTITDDDDEEEVNKNNSLVITTTQSEDNYHPIFGPKRKRGRPPNATRPEVQGDSNWTFVKPTVWDVKHQQPNPIQREHNNNNNTPSYRKPENTTVMTNNLNTFMTTNMDMALSIPKKKRGRKPKKQLVGNSCFVWRDLTAPRGANKKTLLLSKNEKQKG
ncbi:uncharacterized protein BX663DRAFT_527252 [Cokeromyces recurvatus]|uniref:uncharacterized protein n=1 Tax=Cokeromyces recurvatus TaxID=90255 RepID=UPI0022206749|nr:uncharacterized protein BX663DRAFT_527252 [Cokeromyces recurvatus]KAI7897699.1 hypothetical protein BX663DRAFT_527252 [Cokeromyces recurvatus]